MSVLLTKRALPRSLDAPPPEVSEDLALLPSGFGQQTLESSGVSLNLKKLAKPKGAWRLRTGDWRSVFIPTGEDFLVVAVGLRKDIYERLDRMRIVRHAEGIKLIEAEPTLTIERDGRPEAATLRRARRRGPAESNGFSPFDDAMLRRIAGVDDEVLAFLRSVPEGVDLPTVLMHELDDPDLAFLLADLWERPQHHLETFAAGDVPDPASLELEEEELRTRIAAPGSATELIAVDGAGVIRKLLDGSIEEWMVYLHPSQRAIAQADFNGPARVRGGPGTGKTVVALHRARHLARRRVSPPDKVLLTTFLNTLPPVWESLMDLLDDRALAQLEIRNLDQLTFQVAKTGHRQVTPIDPPDRQRVAEKLLKRHSIPSRAIATSQMLLDEFDAFLGGRGIDTLDDYLAVERRGGGAGLRRAEREQVFAAYQEYRETLRKRGLWDWSLLRQEALRLAEEGAGPRFDGVIVDEAQDLSAIGMKLLLALDVSENHRNFLIVGDGQQSIYPGGFSLREVGVDIVGRSRVLTANWRNTWSVWTAAKAIMEGQDFDDLDEEVGLRPTGDEPDPLVIGDPTELHVVRSPAEELELLAALVEDRVASGVDPGDIAVLVEVNRKGVDAARALADAGIDVMSLKDYEGTHAEGVLLGTFNRAKGLEFKEVYIPGLAAAEWPSRWFLPAELEGDERDERLALQLRTLFVAMSRARDRLVLLSGGPPCAPLERASWALEVRNY